MRWDKPNDIFGRWRKADDLPEDGCYMCSGLRRIFSEEKAKFILQPDGRESICQMHEPITEWILASYAEWLDRMMESGNFRRTYPATGLLLSREPGAMPRIHVLDYKCRPRHSYELLLRKPFPDDAQNETTIDPSWVDIKLATMWKDRCITEHKSQCQQFDKAVLTTPDWLIDTENDCIVRGQSTMEFVALSYRWGTSTGSVIDSNILGELQKPGGLSRSAVTGLPIIKDAMHLVRAINERYLWIDATCIIPEDKNHMAHQLQHMGAIYASAKLAIIASDGDGMTGLPGLQGCSASRELNNIFPWVDGSEIVVRDLPVLGAQSHAHSSNYFRRGWTYQEYFLSQRRLVFGRQQIHWVCSCEEFHEDLPHRNVKYDRAEWGFVQFTNILKRQPDFQQLSDLLGEYNNREMTFWTHMVNGPTQRGLEKRKYSAKARSRLPDSELPSWSWIGWKCNDLRFVEDEEDYLLTAQGNSMLGSSMQKWITIPITQWYTHDTPTSNAKHSVSSSWLRPDSNAFDPNTLSQEWKKEKYDAAVHPNAGNGRRLPLDVTGDYVFSHSACPERYYWRPFPVPQNGDMSIPSSIKQGRFISCRTRRGWFRYKREAEYSFDVGMDYHLALKDTEGEICGWIQLPNPYETLRDELAETDAVASDGVAEYTDAEPSVGREPSKSDKLVEVVAICQRARPNGAVWGENGLEYQDRLTYEQFYGVLLIEWANDVAYRKGCGYVKKESWEKHNLEYVDLILG
ncbi:het-domain-containing protein [Trichoderma arundinaceum]|uniref:Het-domain-containing protein n=1 Tax=Trichoderma arundinaceum TaxID=490622 RepID=A0A395P1H0_TRIAR|nr:het-domain-containing protein [Trichoderma arundinaceum]